jgi:predicted transcriptional regulator
MKSKTLDAVLERVATWPEAAQEELAQIALEIEQDLTGTYRATPEELKAIDEGIAAANRGEFATNEEVEAVFAKFRAR